MYAKEKTFMSEFISTICKYYPSLKPFPSFFSIRKKCGEGFCLIPWEDLSCLNVGGDATALLTPCSNAALPDKMWGVWRWGDTESWKFETAQFQKVQLYIKGNKHWFGWCVYFLLPTPTEICGSRGAKSTSPSVCELGCSMSCLVQGLRGMLRQAACSGEL